MHTFKTTLKVLLAQKLMILIYVVWLCLMMFGLSWTLITDLSASDSSVHYESAKADVAVVNRDPHGADLVGAMREFLAKDCNLVDVGTTSEDLQTAAASNYADLIVIVPDGYTQRLASSTATRTAPIWSVRCASSSRRTATSLTSVQRARTCRRPQPRTTRT